MKKPSRVIRIKLDALRALMVQLRLTPADLARRSGLHHSTISRLLAGKTTQVESSTWIGILDAFPRHSFDDLFVVVRSTAGPGDDDGEPAGGDYEDDQEAA